MEMRKFIIELHRDGRISWVEYADQEEDTVKKIINAIKQRKERQQYRAQRAVERGDVESMRENLTSAVEDWLILKLIKYIIRH